MPARPFGISDAMVSVEGSVDWPGFEIVEQKRFADGGSVW